MSLAAMSVSDALKKRFSVRAFRNTPVPQAVLEEIFALARQAPSNCNVQPCRVSSYPARRMFGLPDDVGILFGMSFGYADDAAPANKTRTDRVSLDTMVRFLSD